MLKKRFKLKTSEFKEVFNLGKTSHSPIFVLKSMNNLIEYPRFAVVVSKKISKKAVERNKIRRRFFHAIEELLPLFKNKDYIFILNSSCSDIQYKDLLIKLKHNDY